MRGDIVHGTILYRAIIDGYVLFSYRSTTYFPLLSALRSCLFLPGAYSAVVSKTAMCSSACVLPFVFPGAEFPVRGDTVQGLGRYWGVGVNKHIHTCLPKTFWKLGFYTSAFLNRFGIPFFVEVNFVKRNIVVDVTILRGNAQEWK